MKLIQKQFLKGTREFEIAGDAVNVCLKSPLKEEKLTVMLAVLSPDPVVNGEALEFRSRIKSDPLLSLLRNKPNADEFNRFVDELKRRAREEYSAFTGIKSGVLPAGMEANVFGEPPGFDEPGRRPKNKSRPVRVKDVEVSIQMLNRFLDAGEIESLLAALEALQAEPENETRLTQLAQAFEDLGPQQGAVLTYAPYIGILLADDPFGF